MNAQKLGLPAKPVPIDTLRDKPNQFRGRYLWYKGQLEHISQPNSGHPDPNYRVYEGRLRTVEGEHVLFAVSLPLAAHIEVGDWVRIDRRHLGQVVKVQGEGKNVRLVVESAGDLKRRTVNPRRQRVERM